MVVFVKTDLLAAATALVFWVIMDNSVKMQHVALWAVMATASAMPTLVAAILDTLVRFARSVKSASSLAA
jgi:hypothetical protein